MTQPPNPISERMDNKIALHTAPARRDCEDRFSEWTQTYADLQAKEKFPTEKLFKPGRDYSQEAYGILPRYRFDKATMIEVERLLPHSNNSPEELRSQLIAASDIAESRLHAELNNEIARQALREELGGYKTYTRALSEEDLLSIAPLPSRGVLTTAERKGLWNQLRMTWDIGKGYWFPLKQGPAPPSSLSFHVEYIEAIGAPVRLRDALSRRGISRAFEVHEFGPHEPDYAIELSIFDPACRWGGEQYCTAAGVDWVVFASHESSITIGGNWLTKMFKEKWPECAQRTYLGPYSTNDLRSTWKSERADEI
jgi:hypothetical protein